MSRKTAINPPALQSHRCAALLYTMYHHPLRGNQGSLVNVVDLHGHAEKKAAFVQMVLSIVVHCNIKCEVNASEQHFILKSPSSPNKNNSI
jgi:hypothetical protein